MTARIPTRRMSPFGEIRTLALAGGGKLPRGAKSAPMRLLILTAAYVSGWPRLCPDVPGPRPTPTQPAEAATPQNYFLCRDPGAGFEPSCLGECAKAARHEPEHTLRQDGEEAPCGKRSRHWALPST